MKRIFLLLTVLLLLYSCARVGSPIGGSKDTLAPNVIGANIDSTRINVPRDIKELRIDFDEYITLKDVNKNLIISPPIKNIKRILPSTIANTSLLIQWTDTLQANTTYNFNFGNSIADNNESNILRYYNFAFSTGEKLDDLYISGEVKDGMAIKKVQSSENKMVIGLYQVKDTMNYREKPYYISKVDDDGYYELNYLSPGKYRILAFEDENANSVYDPGKEKVGFQKEEVNVEKSISGLNMKIFPSKKPVKYLEMKEMPGGILMTFEGNPDTVKVNSLNEKLTDFKITHKYKSDSLKIWFDAVKSDIGQTANENLKFTYDAGVIKDSLFNASLFYKYNAKNKMSVDNGIGGSLLPPKTDFKIVSNYVIDRIQPEKWTMKVDSITQNFTAKISETNPYEILIQSNFAEGKKYQLTVPKNTVLSYYERSAESKRFDFEADKVENYGSLTFKLTNEPTANYWLQLLDTSEKVVYQKYTKGKEVKFDIVKPGEYIARILVDNNGNKYWDPADFVTETFAEDAVVYYKLALSRALWDNIEEWDLKDTRTLDLEVAKPKEKEEEQNNQIGNPRDVNSTGSLQNNSMQLRNVR
ncbi:Ig-like domain-containing protein [Chryseobacterium sp.]|uniref:Ig-like domain-containing protein n=1 Tax=Chryseobacterium sp. TaxID=1871047 RepID=UPI002899B3CA|nr:Ig-like domain-containing protein [Chryseobacterium sp.]